MDTSKSLRSHIGIYGKTNSGKSSLLNALLKEDIAIVSDLEGTTTDLVYKPMELPKIGPVEFIDTPGYEDNSPLAKERYKKIKESLNLIDLAIILISGDINADEKFIDLIKDYSFEKIFVLAKADLNYSKEYLAKIAKYNPIKVSIKDTKTIDALIEEISSRDLEEEFSLTKNLVGPNDLVVLVIPIDIQAPKGRLILPQVQTIRDLLDNQAIVVNTKIDNLDQTIDKLKVDPSLIICDSQIFDRVYEKTRPIPLTSFSILMSKLKGI